MSALGQVPLWIVALAILFTVIAAWLFSGVARLVLRKRARLRWSVAIVLSVLGIVVGLLLAELVAPDPRLDSPLALLLTLGMSVVFIAVYAAVAAHFQRPVRASIDDLLHAGESAEVEFKSTARVNLRTGEKDERMEQVVAKTVAAFLNSDGGALLIGVDDHGTPLGLDADLATVKVPDLDRYELWLRDLLVTSLGPAATALVAIDYAEPADAPDKSVCRVEMVASPRPVYLRPGKGAPAELWVRTGNSTRKLGVDDAAEYIMHRWPLGVGSSVAAQLRAAVRFSDDGRVGR